MSDRKKNRMAMLDSLSGSPAPLATQPSSRPLRAARDAVDAHRIWELNPDQIEDTRIADRLNQQDVDDLRQSIETSGQSVPILVRRHQSEKDKYLLVYGRRRLEAIRSSNEISTVKALIASMDDDAAVEAQISENAARRDLSFIEKALFADELLKNAFGPQVRIAEVLGVTKSWMSMALSIVERISPDLIRTIGPAHGVGRPRWEALAKEVEKTEMSQALLIRWVDKTRMEMSLKARVSTSEMSDKLFDTLLKLLTTESPANTKDKKVQHRVLTVGDAKIGAIRRSGKAVQIEFEPGEFADFVEKNADFLLEQMHKHWLEEQQ